MARLTLFFNYFRKHHTELIFILVVVFLMLGIGWHVYFDRDSHSFFEKHHESQIPTTIILTAGQDDDSEVGPSLPHYTDVTYGEGSSFSTSIPDTWGVYYVDGAYDIRPDSSVTSDSDAEYASISLKVVPDSDRDAPNEIAPNIGKNQSDFDTVFAKPTEVASTTDFQTQFAKKIANIQLDGHNAVEYMISDGTDAELIYKYLVWTRKGETNYYIEASFWDPLHHESVDAALSTIISSWRFN